MGVGKEERCCQKGYGRSIIVVGQGQGGDHGDRPMGRSEQGGCNALGQGQGGNHDNRLWGGVSREGEAEHDSQANGEKEHGDQIGRSGIASHERVGDHGNHLGVSDAIGTRKFLLPGLLATMNNRRRKENGKCEDNNKINMTCGIHINLDSVDVRHLTFTLLYRLQ